MVASGTHHQEIVVYEVIDDRHGLATRRASHAGLRRRLCVRWPSSDVPHEGTVFLGRRPDVAAGTPMVIDDGILSGVIEEWRRGLGAHRAEVNRHGAPLERAQHW